MTTKEKIILRSIKEVEMEIKRLKDIIYSNPLSEVIEIRIEAQKLLEVNKTIEQRTDPVFFKKIDELAKRENVLLKKAKKQQDTSKLIDRQVKLEMELSDLNNELFHVQKVRNNFR